MATRSAISGPRESEREPDKSELLSRSPLFRHLNADEAAFALEHLYPRKYRKGEVIVHREDPPGALHVIAEGCVKLSLTSEEGEEVILGMLAEGDWFGEVATLDRGPAPETVTAALPTLTYALRREVLQSLLRNNPRLMMSFVEALATQLRGRNERIEEIHLYDLSTRMARRLLELAERYGTPGTNGIEVPFPLTQAEFGGMLGATRVRVNLVLGSYQDAGVIRLDRGAITILRPGELRRRALHVTQDVLLVYPA